MFRLKGAVEVGDSPLRVEEDVSFRLSEVVSECFMIPFPSLPANRVHERRLVDVGGLLQVDDVVHAARVVVHDRRRGHLEVEVDGDAVLSKLLKQILAF